jgi:hypothetical protein
MSSDLEVLEEDRPEKEKSCVSEGIGGKRRR